MKQQQNKGKSIITIFSEEHIKLIRSTYLKNRSIMITAKELNHCAHTIKKYTKDIAVSHVRQQSIRTLRKALNPLPKAKEDSKSEPMIFRAPAMDKGHVKLKRSERLFATKVYDAKQQRTVPLNDGKNTLIFVNINDKRSNDEVRRAFIEKNQREYKELKIKDYKPSKKK